MNKVSVRLLGNCASISRNSFASYNVGVLPVWVLITN